MVKKGSVVVKDVPAPACGSKEILVHVAYSCISIGTEMAGVNASGLPLYRRALKQPENVMRVLEMVKDQGFKRTMDRVRGKLAAGTPTGYSASGKVVAVGNEVVGFSIGDNVACAGAGIANHAELINVPVNLAVRVPEGLDMGWASTVTLGAIAMQGVRRAKPTLGERIVVVGLGILGQIAVQLLVANGCRVIGVDIDPSRIKIAKEKGAFAGIDLTSEDYVTQVKHLTDGYGADAVLVAAATSSNEVISQAMQACRKKGRIVLIGDVGLGLKRGDFYAKELDFFISCSYGPGRYDPNYEEGGQDYPLPYIRWTENRNMESYLQLMTDKKMSLEGIIQSVYDVEEAPVAYEALKNSEDKPLLVLLSYPQDENAFNRKIPIHEKSGKVSGKINVALAGAGGFAQGMHLPNMVKLKKDFELHSVMSRTGANATAVATQYEAKYATTDYNELLNDEDVDLVMVTTRHNLHAEMLLKALKAGKNVFVEKPLALNWQELDDIKSFLNENENSPVIMTGYNRRFSPAIRKIKENLKNRTSPMIINYRMNAGYIPMDHWVHTDEGGGRNIGEACHIYDVFNFLTGSGYKEVKASAISAKSKHWGRNDNFVVIVSYEDGSICTLTYTALGNKKYAKERMEVFCDDKVMYMDDYKNVTTVGMNGGDWSSNTVQKGQMEELEVLADTLIRDQPWPISMQDQIASTEISFFVEDQIKGKI